MTPSPPKSTADEKQQPERPAVPSVVADRYQVKSELGSGSYSHVHLGHDKVTGQDVAIKFEWIAAEKGNKLLNEAGFCRTVSHGSGMPKVHWSGTQDDYNIMVMDVLGPSLDDLFKKCNKRMDFVSVAGIGEQIVSLLQHVHSCGILHRDIKPQNFLLGRGEEGRKVYIVDFGLAKVYQDPKTGAHIPCSKKRKGITGTLRYTSCNLHRGIEPSRRDELISVGYMMIYLIKGRLPWQGVGAASKHTKQRRVGRRKEKVSHQELCMGYPMEFLQFLQHCDTLAFEEEPDYSHLIGLMRYVVNAFSGSATDQVAPALVPGVVSTKRPPALDYSGDDPKRLKSADDAKGAEEQKKDEDYDYYSYYEDSEEESEEEEEKGDADKDQEVSEEQEDDEEEESEEEDNEEDREASAAA
mmetsp:Transcript_11233/g.25767  ORF Transcript_11233/g.25767 Transcript_11233/m.25767 type:complete len:411 (-) Transcript_11233:49-1281(-)